jgi:hypothetical protein
MRKEASASSDVRFGVGVTLMTQLEMMECIWARFGTNRTTLRNDFLDYFTVHVGQSERASAVHES